MIGYQYLKVAIFILYDNFNYDNLMKLNVINKIIANKINVSSDSVAKAEEFAVDKLDNYVSLRKLNEVFGDFISRNRNYYKITPKLFIYCCVNYIVRNKKN